MTKSTGRPRNWNDNSDRGRPSVDRHGMGSLNGHWQTDPAICGSLLFMHRRRTNGSQLREKLAGIPSLGLAQLPTPLEPLPRLSKHLSGPRIGVKRDDCTGLGLGGNKLRKLNVVLKAALDEGSVTLVSGGVVQSNSQRLIAAAAARLGLDSSPAALGRLPVSSIPGNHQPTRGYLLHRH